MEKIDRKIGLFLHAGNTIEYSVIGDGEPILIMHGGHSNYLEEFGVKSLVENGYSVIIPSRPGYGKTSKQVGESLRLACHYYAELLRYLNIEKVHLLAISAGGPSGLYFAAHYKQFVKTLVLQSAVTKEWLNHSDPEYRAARILFRPKIEKWTWKLVASINNIFPNFIFKQMFPSFSTLSYHEAQNDIFRNDIEAIKRMNNRQRSGGGFFLDLEQINEITRDDIREINCPTLIMHSKHDGSVSLDHAYYAHKNIGSAKLCLLDSWGHLIWLGKSAAEVNKYLFEFLRPYSIKDFR